MRRAPFSTPRLAPSFVGNLLAGIIFASLSSVMSVENIIWLFTAAMFASAAIFIWLASRYKKPVPRVAKLAPATPEADGVLDLAPEP